MQKEKPVGRQTISVEEAAVMLGIGRGLAYESCRRGNFPVPVIRVGTRYLISRVALDKLLAESGE